MENPECSLILLTIDSLNNTVESGSESLFQSAFADLSETDKQKVDTLLAPHGGLASLHADGVIESGIAHNYQLPLNPSNVTPLKQSLKTRFLRQARN